MQILFFYQYFCTPKGSWSTRVYELTRRWVAAGHEVTVVTSPYYKSDIKANGFVSRQEIDGIKLIVIDAADSNKFSMLERALKAIIFSAASVFYALTQPANVIIASSGPITIALPALMAKWVRKIPMVFEVRDLWPAGGIELGKISNPIIIKLALLFEKLCYRHANLVVPCSLGMDQGVKKVWSQTNTLVIPNASDVDLFSNEPKFPEDFPIELANKSIFLYAGSLGFMDDCSQFISGMKYVRNENIILAIAGDGAEKEKLMKVAEETGNKNIYFLGLLPKIEVKKWFSVATASLLTFKVYPVLQTSSPNKMFDSFASGVPIIQSTKGWIKELVERENCGINVNPDSPEEFGDAMSLLANNKKRRNEMASNARKLAENDFNRDILSKKYLSALLEIHAK